MGSIKLFLFIKGINFICFLNIRVFGAGVSLRRTRGGKGKRDEILMKLNEFKCEPFWLGVD